MNHWIHPGWVISKNDGQRHYIGVAALIRLNHLNPATAQEWNSHSRVEPGDRHYFPDYHGNYSRYFEE